MPSNYVQISQIQKNTDMSEFAVRGSIFHTTGDPAYETNAWQYLEDGLLLIKDGNIQQLGSAAELLQQIEASIPVHHYSDSLICPGFVDCHVHYSQTRIIGSPASGLIEWLNRHTFPEELRFEDEHYAAIVATEFFDELLRNGTTCAQVYPTVHIESANQFFHEAHRRGLRMIGGKVLMDRNAPSGLLDGEQKGIVQTEALIEKWHGTGRLSYSVTLRFAGTSTEQQMQACGGLVRKYPDMLFHTHLSETLEEIEWTLDLFPSCSDYLEVYESYGLVMDHSVFAHCIHLSDSESKRLSDAGARAALCPTSNLFLGSGLVQHNRLRDYGIKLSLGSDVGGGTSFSMLRTMHELFKVAQLRGESISVYDLFYLVTLGGARVLHQDRHIGSFEKNKEADFLVLDAGNNPLIQRKLEASKSVEETLFALVILGDTFNVRETWSLGKRVYRREIH